MGITSTSGTDFLKWLWERGAATGPTGVDRFISIPQKDMIGVVDLQLSQNWVNPVRGKPGTGEGVFLISVDRKNPANGIEAVCAVRSQGKAKVVRLRIRSQGTAVAYWDLPG